MAENILVIIKGLITGSAMLVPGMSGASTAIILGIYDKLLDAVGNFRQNIKGNLKLLLMFSAGAAAGIALFARVVSGIIEAYPMPSMYFFSGAAAGSVPMIFRASRISSRSFGWIIYSAIGAAAVFIMSKLPVLTFSSELSGTIYLLMSGFILSAALILPGISVSYMLLVMGLYERTAAAAGSLDIAFLLPLAAGLTAGVFLISKLLSRAMTRHPGKAYPLILGFMIGSLADMLPGVPAASEILICLLAAAAGFVVVYNVSRYNAASDTE